MVDARIAELLLSLFFIPGSSYFRCYPYRHQKEAISLAVIERHAQGELSVGAPSSYVGLAKWVAVDIDCLDQNLVKRAMNLLWENGLPAYASFSGCKGYHVHIFLQEPIALSEAQRISAKVKRLLEGDGIHYDKISPSPNGKGGDCMCLPLGTHPDTSKHRYLLDHNLEPVNDPLDFLQSIMKLHKGLASIPDNEVEYLDIETGAIRSATNPDLISGKDCVNKLWREGIQAPHTRHSATCAITNAIARSQIPTNEKENALLDWVCRAYENASKKGFTTSSFDYWISEARRIWKNYSTYNYAPLCENQIFRDAMRSACDDELGCRLAQDRGIIDNRMLKRLQVWNAHNAKPPGLGKSAQAVYEALQDIAENNRILQHDGAVVFSTTQQEIAALSNCTPKTVRKHVERLIEVGLVTKPSRNTLPHECRQTRWQYYGLPLLTEQLLQRVLDYCRTNG